MFPFNTIIAWYVNIYHKYEDIIITYFIIASWAYLQQEGGAKGSHRGPTPLGAGPPEAAPRVGVAHLPGLRLPPSPITSLRNPKLQGATTDRFPPPLGGGKHRERKISPADRFLLGEFLPGEGRPSPSTPS